MPERDGQEEGRKKKEVKSGTTRRGGREKHQSGIALCTHLSKILEPAPSLCHSDTSSEQEKSKR